MTTKKTIKTVLFASLIAAMILPFSVMDYAVAEETKKYNISDELDKLISEFNALEVQRQQIKQDIRTADTKDEIIKLEDELSSIETEMDSIEVEAVKLAAQEKAYAPSNNNSTIASATTTGSTINAGSTHTTCDSSVPSSTNSATGAIDTNIDTISWDWNVADLKSTGWWIFCTDVYFEEISMTVRNNTKQQSCTMKTDNQTSGSLVQTCNCGISNGDLLSWAVETTYEPLSGSNTAGNDDWRGLHRVA